MTPLHPGWLAALVLGGVVLVQLVVIAGVVRAWQRDNDAREGGR